MRNKHWFLLTCDIVIVFIAFLIATYLKTDNFKALFNQYWYQFISFEIIWVGSSLIFNKYKPSIFQIRYGFFISTIRSNALIVFIITFFIFFISVGFSRLNIIYTVFFATLIELVLGYFFLIGKSLDNIRTHIRILIIDSRIYFKAIFSKWGLLLIIGDIVIVFFAYLLAAYFKTGQEKALFNYYWLPFILFEIIWIVSSIIFNKYNPKKSKQKPDFILAVIKSNILIIFVTTFIIFFASLGYSRLNLIYTVILATFIEGILGYLILLNKVLNKDAEQFDSFLAASETLVESEIVEELAPVETITETKSSRYKQLRDIIIKEVGSKEFDFIAQYTPITSNNTLIIATTTIFNILNQHKPYKYFVNLKRINDIQYINKFFESVNSKLEKGGLFINFVETKTLRKARILAKYPPLINWIFYTEDYIVKRIMPKLIITQKLYFFLTRGLNRVLSRAETLGRLYSCGFEIIEEAFIGNYLFFVARKIKEPAFDLSPTYGPYVKLRRIGKHGRIIKVYKFRTMHPFSEYLQPYLYKNHNLAEGGKFKNDFRVTTLGRLLRKCWLDELPMLINLINGDVKIVGVRPLSRHYFFLYTKELQKKRIKYKPGIVPPFYADMPNTIEEIMASELRYLEAYEKHPIRTDIKYFFKAFHNICIKKARSN